MQKARIIPCLLISGNGLVKTKKFKDPVYVGDPVNAVRIFSEKEVDEIIILDIDASKDGVEPNYALIEEIAGEAFMPLAYGGGIKNIDQVRRLIRAGIEKVVINSASFNSVEVIKTAVEIYGSQAVIGAVDVKRTLFGGYKLVELSATREVKVGLEEHIQNLVAAGVGEIVISSVDRDGMMSGMDISLIKQVSLSVDVPVIAIGGAGCIEDLKQAVDEGGASAVAAGSMFVFHGKHRAVLISYLPAGTINAH